MIVHVVLKCCGHLRVLGSLPMDVHVGLEYVVVTLVLLVHCCERSRSAEVCCGHLSALGTLPMGVHAGLECTTRWIHLVMYISLPFFVRDLRRGAERTVAVNLPFRTYSSCSKCLLIVKVSAVDKKRTCCYFYTWERKLRSSSLTYVVFRVFRQCVAPHMQSEYGTYFCVCFMNTPSILTTSHT